MPFRSTCGIGGRVLKLEGIIDVTIGFPTRLRQPHRDQPDPRRRSRQPQVLVVVPGEYPPADALPRSGNVLSDVSNVPVGPAR